MSVVWYYRTIWTQTLYYGHSGENLNDWKPRTPPYLSPRVWYLSVTMTACMSQGCKARKVKTRSDGLILCNKCESERFIEDHVNHDPTEHDTESSGTRPERPPWRFCVAFSFLACFVSPASWLSNGFPWCSAVPRSCPPLLMHSTVTYLI